MKVIVLTSGEYSAYQIHGVFSSEEKAKEYASLLTQGEDGPGSFSHEEYEVDAPLSESWQTVYGCSLDIDGNLHKEWTKRELLPPAWTEMKPFNQSSTEFVSSSTVSAEHAMKLAAEVRQSWLREVPNARFCWWSRAIEDGPVEITKGWYSDDRGFGVSKPDTSRLPYSTMWPSPGEGSPSKLQHWGLSLVSAEDAAQQIEKLRSLQPA
jgi:hypothetical protein